ncbi:nitroreductase/quinone reductase family protein [Nocardia sp. NPDC058518]|uniref:nitroreductase/quinone reductase family protein n=1 Tax=Nocardia sp. NPDC058518 TaxID=3346534 RepID=UPI00366074FE
MTASTTTPPTVPGYVNWVVKRLLRSPAHRVMSKTTMLLTFAGRQTGNRYVAVVRYLRQGELVSCYTDSKWWINLRDEPAVELLIAGRRMTGIATVVEDPAVIADSLSEFLHTMPGDSKYYGVRRNAQGLPRADDIAEAAKHTRLIRIQLASGR